MNFRTLLLFSILCMFWGIPYFFIKLAVADIAPVCVAWGRITLAACVLLPMAWRRGTLPTTLRHKGAIVAFAVSELVIPFSLIAVAEQQLSSSLAGVLVASVPLTIVLIAPLFGVHERLTARRLGGLLLGLVGVVVLLGFDSIAGAAQWWAVAAITLAIIGYAVGPLVVQRHLAGVDEIASLAMSLLVASLLLLPMALLSWPSAMPSAVALGSVAVLGLISTAAALLLYFHVIHAAGAARASVVAYISPAVAVLLGILALHEHFGVGIAVGLVLILVGSALGSSGSKKHAQD